MIINLLPLPPFKIKSQLNDVKQTSLLYQIMTKSHKSVFVLPPISIIDSFQRTLNNKSNNVFQYCYQFIRFPGFVFLICKTLNNSLTTHIYVSVFLSKSSRCRWCCHFQYCCLAFLSSSLTNGTLLWNRHIWQGSPYSPPLQTLGRTWSEIRIVKFVTLVSDFHVVHIPHLRFCECT